MAQITLDNGSPTRAFVRHHDGAVLLAYVPESASVDQLDAAVAERFEGGAPSPATDEFAPAPCESPGHLPLAVWDLEQRELTRACGARPDLPAVEERINELTPSALRCDPPVCGGAPCDAWIWLRTPTSCAESARLRGHVDPPVWIDLDGPVGTPRSQAACEVDPDGKVWTRVLGVEVHDVAHQPALVAAPGGEGLAAAAEMRGYLTARSLGSIRPSEGALRLRFWCQAVAGKVLNLATKGLEAGRYFAALDEPRGAPSTSDSMVRLDDSWTGARPWLWGRASTCPSGAPCEHDGTWSDPTVPLEDRLAKRPIFVAPWLDGDGAKGFDALELLCDEASGRAGTWMVWAR